MANKNKNVTFLVDMMKYRTNSASRENSLRDEMQRPRVTLTSDEYEDYIHTKESCDRLRELKTHEGEDSSTRDGCAGGEGGSNSFQNRVGYRSPGPGMRCDGSRNDSSFTDTVDSPSVAQDRSKSNSYTSSRPPILRPNSRFINSPSRPPLPPRSPSRELDECPSYGSQQGSFYEKFKYQHLKFLNRLNCSVEEEIITSDDESEDDLSNHPGTFKELVRSALCQLDGLSSPRTLDSLSPRSMASRSFTPRSLVSPQSLTSPLSSLASPRMTFATPRSNLPRAIDNVAREKAMMEEELRKQLDDLKREKKAMEEQILSEIQKEYGEKALLEAQHKDLKEVVQLRTHLQLKQQVEIEKRELQGMHSMLSDNSDDVILVSPRTDEELEPKSHLKTCVQGPMPKHNFESENSSTTANSTTSANSKVVMFKLKKSQSNQSKSAKPPLPRLFAVIMTKPGPLGLEIQGSTFVAKVARVVSNSQADKAGIKGGDVICHPGSDEEFSYQEFLKMVQSGIRPLRFNVKRYEVPPAAGVRADLDCDKQQACQDRTLTKSAPHLADKNLESNDRVYIKDITEPVENNTTWRNMSELTSEINEQPPFKDATKTWKGLPELTNETERSKSNEQRTELQLPASKETSAGDEARPEAPAQSTPGSASPIPPQVLAVDLLKMMNDIDQSKAPKNGSNTGNKARSESLDGLMPKITAYEEAVKNVNNYKKPSKTTSDDDRSHNESPVLRFDLLKIKNEIERTEAQKHENKTKASDGLSQEVTGREDYEKGSPSKRDSSSSETNDKLVANDAKKIREEEVKAALETLTSLGYAPKNSSKDQNAEKILPPKVATDLSLKPTLYFLPSTLNSKPPTPNTRESLSEQQRSRKASPFFPPSTPQSHSRPPTPLGAKKICVEVVKQPGRCSREESSAESNSVRSDSKSERMGAVADPITPREIKQESVGTAEIIRSSPMNHPKSYPACIDSSSTISSNLREEEDKENARCKSGGAVKTFNSSAAQTYDQLFSPTHVFSASSDDSSSTMPFSPLEHYTQNNLSTTNTQALKKKTILGESGKSLSVAVGELNKRVLTSPHSPYSAPSRRSRGVIDMSSYDELIE